MIPRNPNGLSPRTMRDCTFCDWADPIERPTPRAPLVVRLYVWALCLATVGLLIYRVL